MKGVEPFLVGYPLCLGVAFHIITISQTMGLLQVLCELTKSGSVEVVTVHAPAILEVAKAVQANPALLQNTLIRKFRTKLISRTVLRLLPASPLVNRSKGRCQLSRWPRNTDHRTQAEL